MAEAPLSGRGRGRQFHQPMPQTLVAPIRAIGFAVAVAFAPAVSGAQATVAHPHVDVASIEARPQDVATLDGVVLAFYDVVTGPPGQPRQWARDRTLYWPGIRFFTAGVKPDGSPTGQAVTHQEYVDQTNAALVKRGFDEHEIHRVTYRVGNIVHIMSTYETRTMAGGPLDGRGVNSIDLFWDGHRWWITAASWDDERPGSPIPPELLK